MLKQLLIAGEDSPLLARVRSAALRLGTAPRYIRRFTDASRVVSAGHGVDLMVVCDRLEGGSGERLLHSLVDLGVPLPPTLLFAQTLEDPTRSRQSWGSSVMRRRPPASEGDAQLAVQFLLRAAGALRRGSGPGPGAGQTWVLASTDEVLHAELCARAGHQGASLLLARDSAALSAALTTAQPGVLLLDLAGAPQQVRAFCGVCNEQLPRAAVVVELERWSDRGVGPVQLGPRHWFAPRGRAVEAALAALPRPTAAPPPSRPDLPAPNDPS